MNIFEHLKFNNYGVCHETESVSARDTAKVIRMIIQLPATLTHGYLIVATDGQSWTVTKEGVYMHGSDDESAFDILKRNKIEWEVEISRTVTQSAYANVIAYSQEEAEELLAVKAGVTDHDHSVFDWDVDDIDVIFTEATEIEY